MRQTYVHTHETVSTVKRTNLSLNLRSFLMPLCNSSPAPEICFLSLYTSFWDVELFISGTIQYIYIYFLVWHLFSRFSRTLGLLNISIRWITTLPTYPRNRTLLKLVAACGSKWILGCVGGLGIGSTHSTLSLHMQCGNSFLWNRNIFFWLQN